MCVFVVVSVEIYPFQGLGLPKLRDTILAILVVRTKLFGGLYGGGPLRGSP